MGSCWSGPTTGSRSLTGRRSSSPGCRPRLARPGAHVADLLRCRWSRRVRRRIAAGRRPGAAIEDRSAPTPTYQRINRRGQDMEVRTTFLADGRFIRTYTDVTLHHAALRAEAVLRDQAVAAQAALAAAFENVPHGVLLTGADRRVQVINAIAAELIELPPELARPGAALRDILAFQLERGDFAGTPAVVRGRPRLAGRPPSRRCRITSGGCGTAASSTCGPRAWRTGGSSAPSPMSPPGIWRCRPRRRRATRPRPPRPRSSPPSRMPRSASRWSARMAGSR